jgi:hypothetical protein
VNIPSVRIEFLYWEDCPSHQQAWDRLMTVLEEKGLKKEVARIDIQTNEDAQAWNFCGSPTIRVNGRDIDPEGAKGQRIGLNCRIYHTPDERISPLPSEEMIRKALDQNLQ